MSEQMNDDAPMSLPERREGETFRAWYARLTEAQQDEYDGQAVEWIRAVESAERAIVEAADRWQRAEAEWEAANREWNIAGMREPGVSDADRERFYPALAEVRQARENIKNAVDSWRKLKGKA